MSTTDNRAEIRESRRAEDRRVNDERKNAEEVNDEATSKSTTELVTEKVVRAANSEDQPMGRETPQAPFALVGLSYLAALALVILIGTWIVFAVLS